MIRVRVPKGMLMVNAAIAALAVFLGVWLVRDLGRSRPIPAPGAPRPAQVKAAPDGDAKSPAADERLATYNTIPAKYLFNPQRSEGAPAAAAVVAPLPPKPLLHGVIVDGAYSVAYLEDPGTKRVLVYRVGDAVAGGTLAKIEQDRIEIKRSDGQMNVLLRDPGKPRPVETAEGTSKAAQRGAAQAATPPSDSSPASPPPARFMRRTPPPTQ